MSAETKRYLDRQSVGVATTIMVEQKSGASLKAWRLAEGIVRVMYWEAERGSERYIDLSDEQALHFAEILRRAASPT